MIFRTLLAVAVAGIILFGGLLLHSNKEYSEGDMVYEQVKSVLADKHSSSKIDFATLQEINHQIVGWLQAAGGMIDYPIVRGEDNEYYLSHLFNHEPNKLGSLFMDYRNDGGFSNKNTAIYGHNMKDGSMFSSLTKYKNQSYYDNFPTMMLYTPDGDFMIELFAGMVADGDEEFIRWQFSDDGDFLRYIKTLQENSTFASNTTVQPCDRIVTLITCSYQFNNARYALYGKVMPIVR